jgi:hypothetical protein
MSRNVHFPSCLIQEVEPHVEPTTAPAEIVRSKLTAPPLTDLPVVYAMVAAEAFG